MRTRINIELVIDGNAAAAMQAVEAALDTGVLQDSINDYGTENEIEIDVASAVSTFAANDGVDDDDDHEEIRTDLHWRRVDAYEQTFLYRQWLQQSIETTEGVS